LRESLRTQLAARDIRETSPAQADLDVVRHVLLREKVAVQLVMGGPLLPLLYFLQTVQKVGQISSV
jgi:hypothetical protein